MAGKKEKAGFFGHVPVCEAGAITIPKRKPPMTNVSAFIACMLCVALLSPAYADFPVRQGPNKETTPVVAYNSTDHVYLAVWTEEFKIGATAASSVKGRIVSENGTLLGDPFTITPLAAYPTVAYNPTVNEFVVAANSYGNIVGQRISGSGAVIGGQVALMPGSIKARIVCNSLSGEYLIVGVQTTPPPGASQQFFSSTISADLQTVSVPQLLFSRISGDAMNATAPAAVEGEVDIALAFAPIQTGETPRGRYLLVVGPGVDVRMLDSDGAIIRVLHDDQLGNRYPHLPFCTGYPTGGEFNVDVAYGWGQIDGTSCPAFLIVWSDNNNEYYGYSWTGIWGGYVDATKLVYDAHELVPDRSFPICNGSGQGMIDSLVAQWRPNVSYNPSSQTFFAVWHEIPTDLSLSPTAKPNIRCNRIKGVDPWIPMIISDTVGLSNPQYPAVAASTTNEYAFAVWQDSRDSIVTATDIFGTIERVGTAVVVPTGGFVVTNTNNEGSGSLRQAILGANARVGKDSITFNIPGSGPHTIRPSSPLPFITDTLVIDGYSQPGSAVNTNSLARGTNAVLKIELDGSDAGSDAHGLVCASPWCYVRGLVVNRFAKSGIVMNGAYNLVLGCFVGTDVTGRTRAGNGSGVSVIGTTPRSIIGGAGLCEYRNLISGNTTAGVIVDCEDGHVYLMGNLIGTDATGTSALGNTEAGITYLSGGKLWMGGFTEDGANVIAGCGNDGSNGQPVIKGAGVFIGEGGHDAVFSGNIIGLNAAGNSALANFMDGILARSPCTVVPDSESLPNVISGNAFSGVRIEKRHSDDSVFSVIEGALIGTDITGENPVGNQSGVTIGEGAQAEIGAGNVIAHNRGDGIAVCDSGSARITRNAIFENGGLGINLVGGVEDGRGWTANDSLDRDRGPSGLQNRPVVLSAIGGERLKITCSLSSEPDKQYQLEFFLCPPGGTPASGEGWEYVASVGGRTGSSGEMGDVTVELGRPTPAGWVVTATASRWPTALATSEFSEPVTVTVPTGFADMHLVPQETALMQNYPNPFNPTTKLRYTVGVVGLPAGQAGGRWQVASSHVRLAVYDVLGREVRVLLDEFKAPGRYAVEFNANNLASGVYYYRLTAGEFSETKKMMVVR
jgi:hypothetical protein